MRDEWKQWLLDAATGSYDTSTDWGESYVLAGIKTGRWLIQQSRNVMRYIYSQRDHLRHPQGLHVVQTTSELNHFDETQNMLNDNFHPTVNMD